MNERERLRQAAARWRGAPRSPGIPEPGPGQESVWDYPRPPSLERDERRIRIEHAGIVIADTSRAWRICETASPPTFYLPREDVRVDLLEPDSGRSLCEWKGQASYWTLRVGDVVVRHAAWSYRDPEPTYAAIQDHLAFYPGRLDACTVGGARVRAQAGDFYGGWITPEVLGPFKGDPGTLGW